MALCDFLLISFHFSSKFKWILNWNLEKLNRIKVQKSHFEMLYASHISTLHIAHLHFIWTFWSTDKRSETRSTNDTSKCSHIAGKEAANQRMEKWRLTTEDVWMRWHKWFSCTLFKKYYSSDTFSQPFSDIAILSEFTI